MTNHHEPPSLSCPKCLAEGAIRTNAGNRRCPECTHLWVDDVDAAYRKAWQDKWFPVLSSQETAERKRAKAKAERDRARAPRVEAEDCWSLPRGGAWLTGEARDMADMDPFYGGDYNRHPKISAGDM